jgi:cation transport ATPase
METTELKVEGMTCGSWVAAVTKALKRVPGIADVDGAERVAAVVLGRRTRRQSDALAWRLHRWRLARALVVGPG